MMMATSSNHNHHSNKDSVKGDDESIVINGIEEIKISDGMDVDDEVCGKENSHANAKVLPKASSNGFSNSTVSINGKSMGNGNSISSAVKTEVDVSDVKIEPPVMDGAVSATFKTEVGVSKMGPEKSMVSVDQMNGNMNVPPPIAPKCANGKISCLLDGTPAFPCKRCHRVFYCSEEHREQNLQEHQTDCKTVSSLEVLYLDEDYSMWLKHAAPHLYDTCLNFVLVWPSLTVQWLPEIEEREDNILRHHLLLGTMTNQEQNHLLVCGIDVIDRSKTDSGAVASHAAKFNGTLYVLKRINHEAEVNRARYMPQDSNIVATKSSSSEVFIFDSRKHPNVPEDSNFSPLLRLRGHQKEGFGLSWSPKEAGKILSGSNDAIVCLWDLNKTASMDHAKKVRYLNASRIFKGHEDVVEDVNWHSEQRYLFASVGDDKRLNIWDTRTADSELAAIKRTDAHAGDINAVSFAPFNENCLATCSSDCTVAIWDMRNVNKKVHSLEYHGGEVMQVQWSPHSGTLLASTGKDNRVFVWDLQRVIIENDSAMEEYDDENAPTELSFIHGGHTANVNDISWNHHERGMIASVTEDNILQVWKISEDLQVFYAQGSESDDEESQGSASDVVMED